MPHDAAHPDRYRPDRILGAFLGLACGDALGAPAEFTRPADMAEAFPGGVRDMVGGGSFHWAPGEWTDDTGMSLCVADGILAAPSDPVAATGERFLTWVEGARDVGNTIRAAIGAYRRNPPAGWPAAAASTPQARQGKAAGNGSLMRTLPVALAYPDRAEMLRHAATISAMTHWDPQAEACCAVYCLWIRDLLRGRDRADAWERALRGARSWADEGGVRTDGGRTERTPGPLPADHELWQRLADAPLLAAHQVQPSGYAGSAPECLEAAAWACLSADSAEEAIVTVVNLGGESDTMGAVTGGAAGAAWGIDALPARWLRALHQNDRLIETAHRLAELRHLLVYAPPGPPPFTRYPVTDRLLAGRNPLTELDARELAAAGVTHVLDLREDSEWAPDARHGAEAVDALARLGIERRSVPIRDTDSSSHAALDEAVGFLRTALEPSARTADGRPTRVYVHCRAGVERTGSILAAYVARAEHLSVDDAVAQLRAAAPQIQPLPWQLDAVRAWLGR
jgi:ADP-ribosyl-[dinitrogen reductase] hydrolase